jgi:phosphocarrier protein
MPEREVTISNRLGLHARAAAKLVNLASQFNCEIQLRRDERIANAKSIMGVMMLAAAKGTALLLYAEGSDAEQALDQIEALIRHRFDEPE